MCHKAGHRVRIWSMVLVAAALGVAPVRAQEAVPEFFVDAVVTRGAGVSHQSRVDLYLRIPFERLSFKNSIDGFTARYEVSVEALTPTGNGLTSTPVRSRTWDATFRVPTYAETTSSSAFVSTTQAIDLDPGSYQLSVHVRDLASGESFVRELPLEVRDLNRPHAISDLTLLESYDPATLSIVPRADNVVGTEEPGFDLFCEVFSAAPRQVRIRHQVLRIHKDGGSHPIPEEGLDPSSGEVVSERSAVIDLTTGRSQHVVHVPIEDMKVGTYGARAWIEDGDGNVIDETFKVVQVRWTGLAAHIQDVDLAIEQLEYIANRKDLQHIRSAPTRAERYARFRAFWDRRDPTPGTRRNESMEEYYYRVNFANRRYSAVTDGWKTDRGFVLVKFGEPDIVERRPHSFDFEPYEVWVYQRMGRQYIFVDKTGFGDYQLLVPVWDERTRLY
jgi:GWxTD domain-containing protein